MIYDALGRKIIIKSDTNESGGMDSSVTTCDKEDPHHQVQYYSLASYLYYFFCSHNMFQLLYFTKINCELETGCILYNRC